MMTKNKKIYYKIKHGNNLKTKISVHGSNLVGIRFISVSFIEIE